MENDAELTPAERLRRQLEQPLFNPLLRQWVARGESDYELYLRTRELLALQTPRAQRSVPDELLFQVAHQTQELWLKLLAHEAVEAVEELDTDALWPASARLERMARVAHHLSLELRALETLTPDTFLTIRRNLGEGSGQQSPGYNAVRVAMEGLEQALARLLSRRSRKLSEVYERPGAEDLKRLCELLLDVDEGFQAWLCTHYQLVRRTLGVNAGVYSLDGVSTLVLTKRMTQPLFPMLWEVRVEMTARWRREGGHAPGASREPKAPAGPPPASEPGSEPGSESE